MCRIDGAEPPEFWFDEIRRARIEHRCWECSRPIVAGEQYEHVATKWAGEFATVKTCLQCREARQFLIHECSGYVCGQVLEEIVEHWDEGMMRFSLGRLIVAMKNQWSLRQDTAPMEPSRVAVLVRAATAFEDAA